MHGVSHIPPGEEAAAPPPTHHAPRQLLQSHPLALQSRHASSAESFSLAPAQPRPLPRPPASSSSSLVDLSQPGVVQRVSPLERAHSQLSLTVRGRGAELATPPALPARSHGTLSRQRSQVRRCLFL